VAAGPNQQAVVAANVLRGAVDGTLEQTLVDHVTANVPPTVELRSSLSTSLLFAKADAQRVPTVLVTSDQTRMDASIPADALARLFDDIRQGNYALALGRSIEVAGLPRYAWWRVDPRTGETVAVTDEGLHQAGNDYVLVTEQEEGKWDATLVAGQQRTVTPLAQGLAESAMHDFIRQLVAAGFRNIIIPGF
jgi:hypothetical protein